MEEQPTDLITDATIATYMKGPPAESAEFDFLLGAWNTRTVRYDASGAERRAHRGRWTARHLAGGRIVLDETVLIRDHGTEIGSMATLRSYCPDTTRWEMTFLSAQQPVLPISFVGRSVGEERHLEVHSAIDPTGPAIAHVRFFAIGAEVFEWEQRMSFDAGRTYSRTVWIHAVRA